MTPDSAEGGTVEGSPNPPRPPHLLELRDVSVRFGARSGWLTKKRDGSLAVDRVSLSIERGSTLGIVGATGSGKSTIARLVMGMVQPTSGSVTVSGRDVNNLGPADRATVQRRRQIVLQDPYSAVNGRMKVSDIIAEPLLAVDRRHPRPSEASLKDRVHALLDMVGLPPSKANGYPHQFSGGQLQRVSIARALAPEPDLIVLDEPTSALDVSVRAQILNLLKSLQERLGVSYLVISHDLATVSYLASTVAVMHRGRIVEKGTTSALYSDPLHPYTVELLASAPSSHSNFLERVMELPVARGPAPDSGCLYSHQCALRREIGDPHQCVDEEPRLTVGVDHTAACHFSNEIDRLLVGRSLDDDAEVHR